MQDVSKLGLKINPHILCSLSCIFFYLEQFSSCILRMRICHTCPSVKVQLSLIGLAVLTSTTINTGSLFLQFNPVCYSIFALLYGYLQLLAFSIIFFPTTCNPIRIAPGCHHLHFKSCLQRLQQIIDSSNCYSLFFFTNDNTLPPHSLKRARTTSVS